MFELPGSIMDVRNDNERTRWSTKYVNAPTLIPLLTFFGCLLSIIPLFGFNFYTQDDDIITTTNLQLDTVIFKESAIASFFLIVPTALDTFIDANARLYRFLTFYGKKEELAVADNAENQKHLSLLERSLFLTGIALECTIVFYITYMTTRNEVAFYNCINSCQTILLTLPVLCFLERTTKLWTSALAISVSFCYAAGASLASFANLYDNHRDYQYSNSLKTASFALYGIASILFILVCLKGTYDYVRPKLVKDIKSNKQKRVHITDLLQEGTYLKKHSNDLESLNNTIVSAAHMASGIVAIIGVFVIYYVLPANSLSEGLNYAIYSYIAQAAGVCVLLVEMRTKKFDIQIQMLKLLEQKTTYVRYISHEMRTPLNAALAGLQILVGDLKRSVDPIDMDRYETVQEVMLSCTTAVDILNDLLTFEKLNSGLFEIHKLEVSLPSFMDDCVDLFTAQADAKAIILKLITTDHILELDEDEPMRSILPDDVCLCDKFKLSQVARNLISNALKFTPDGGTVTVRGGFFPLTKSASNVKGTLLGDREKGDKKSNDDDETIVEGMFRFSVQDTGAGISESDQKRLFKEVVQFRPDVLQAGGGSGFGLFISKGIVDLHNGEIGVFSEGEGKGTTFWFSVPMQQAHQKPRSRKSSVGGGNRLVQHSLRGFAQSNKSEVGGVVRHSPTHAPSRPSFPTDSPILSSKGSLLFNKTPCELLPSLTLPDGVNLVVRSTDERAELLRSPTTDRYPPSTEPSYFLLVVDDSALNRKMLLKLLNFGGHRCEEADDGLVAVSKIKEKMEQSLCYDAILMDFVMPKMNGPTATKEIRALGYKGPIFGVTGNGLESDINLFMSCGADRVLIKPLYLTDFNQAMKNMRLRSSVKVGHTDVPH